MHSGRALSSTHSPAQARATHVDPAEVPMPRRQQEKTTAVLWQVSTGATARAQEAVCLQAAEVPRRCSLVRAAGSLVLLAGWPPRSTPSGAPLKQVCRGKVELSSWVTVFDEKGISHVDQHQVGSLPPRGVRIGV
ncbi:hypothetical protein NDU88_004449 [Pleurodeles waltl]|uniref:Uncharacterized protein n=1 Tax=Pleurodeles waltl TaxID=8319 RepID=A0AAV7PCI1_PLEWA|nr:hypothetical protein NDU88_004449 [Pleurodeles waltl]